MLGPRIVKEGIGRGNGESITANAMISRGHTNVTETNQRPASNLLCIAFFLSWVSKTQPNHWTEWMSNT